MTRETLTPANMRQCPKPSCLSWNTTTRSTCGTCGLQFPPDLRAGHSIETTTGTKAIAGQGEGMQPGGNGRKKKPALNGGEWFFRQQFCATIMPSGWVGCWQTYRFQFADGTEYRPDCVIVPGYTIVVPDELPPEKSIVVEIKGKAASSAVRAAWTRQGIERYRRARENFPQFEWHCYEVSGGKVKEILGENGK